VAALNACDTAGYKSVKFTGYLFRSEKGEVIGFEGAEMKTAELTKEIEMGKSRR
jgi:hypothetical protein